MANGCVLQNNTFAAGERPVFCPRPRRIYAAPAFRPIRCNPVFPAEVSDLHPNDLLDIFLPKQTDSTPPFFCGSPPSRSDNPVVHDVRFGQADLAVPLPLGPAAAISGSASASATSRSGCTRVRYGFAPATVRVEGFDCLDRETCQSRGVPAFA